MDKKRCDTQKFYLINKINIIESKRIDIVINIEFQKFINSLKPTLEDYCSSNFEVPNDHPRDVKELETLIEYNIPENNNIDSKLATVNGEHLRT